MSARSFNNAARLALGTLAAAALSVAGTAAMFLVGGGILSHGIAPLHHGIEVVSAKAGGLGGVVSMALDAVVGSLLRVAAALKPAA